jgi:hypothetical protein
MYYMPPTVDHFRVAIGVPSFLRRMERVQSRAAQAVRFSVVRHAAWAPGVESAADWEAWADGQHDIGGDAVPALREMPPLLRRHAGSLGRMACDAAYRALAGAVNIPIVFCSRYGEVTRSVELLAELARGAPLSPTAFGLSVHSAASGLLSIARHDGANVVALAAGEASTALGIIEACGLLADGADQVLLVAADVALPSLFREFQDVQPVPYAWAWLLSPPDGSPVSLSWDTLTGDPAAPVVAADGPRRLPAALEVLRFLLRGDGELVHDAEGHRWHWRRHA